MIRTFFKKSKIVRLLGLMLLLALLSPSVMTNAEEEIAMHLYTDETDGTTFMLPDGWTEKHENTDGTNCVITSTQYPGQHRLLIFMHISVDSWANEGSMYSRTFYDFYMNRPTVISRSIGNAEIEEVVFNGVTYFRYSDLESNSPYFQYYRFHNGIMHMFQFDVDTDDPNYIYFETIMNSVEFPEIP